MPDAISSNDTARTFSACDSTNSSCPEPTVSSSSAIPAGPTPPIVQIPPVRIEASATSRLVQSYDAQTRSAPCATDKGNAVVACAAILPSMEGGPYAAFAASLLCGRATRVYVDCLEAEASHARAIETCEERGGTAAPSVRPDEIVCEIPRSSSAAR